MRNAQGYGGVQCGRQRCFGEDRCCDNENCDHICGLETWTPMLKSCEPACAMPGCDCSRYTQVSCGGHDKYSCANCPPLQSRFTEGGASYCNGDCRWDARSLTCTAGRRSG